MTNTIPAIGTRRPQPDQILGRAPDGRPYFLDERDFQWANPNMRLPLSQPLTHALNYLRVLLSSKDDASWRRLKSMIPTLMDFDLSIAPRWRRMHPRPRLG